MLTFHIITLFPESIEPYVDSSILGRAQKRKHIAIKYCNPRDYVERKDGNKEKRKDGKLTYAERRVDDRPYGGGPGMVMEAMPVIKAVEAALKEAKRKKRPEGRADGGSKEKTKIIFFSPSGKQFTNEVADSFKKYTDIVLICGRYEGIDARVKKAFPMTDISVGPYTLTGGEVPAMIMIDSITRRIPGVLGHDSSIEERRVAGKDVYTRPEVITYKGKKYRVPKILLTGHHKKIDEWKMKGHSALRASGSKRKK